MEREKYRREGEKERWHEGEKELNKYIINKQMQKLRKKMAREVARRDK